MPSLNTKLASAPNTQTNYVLKATSSTTIGNSIIQDNGSTATIGGSLTLSASTGFPTVGLLNRSSDNNLYIVSGSSGFILLDNSQNTMYNATPTSHTWQISNSPKMTLNSSGNVGIGNTNPFAGVTSLTGLAISDRGGLFKLAVNDVMYFSNNLYYDGANWKRITANGGMFMQLESVDGGTLRIFGAATGSAGSNATTLDRLMLNSSGYVGIGTGSPVGPLTIALPATGSAIAATNAQQAYDYSRLRIKHYTDSNVGLSIGYAGANYTYVQTCYNEGSTSPLLLNPFGGTILVNTTSDPSAGARFIVANGFQQEGICIKMVSTGAYSPIAVRDTTGAEMFNIRENGAMDNPYAYNTTTGSAATVFVNAQGRFLRSTASSQRFKENIIDWDGDGLNTILSLKPKTFSYKEDYYSHASRQFLGLIAEEVAEVSSYLADFENEDGTGQVENVRYANIVVPLIKAIQELNQTIQQQQQQINQLINK